MNTAATRILLFATGGFLAGIVNALGQYVLPDIQVLQQHYPPVVVGITLYLCGIYVAGFVSRKPLLSLLTLIIFCVFSWRIAIDVGYALGGPAPFVTSGGLGAFVVAWGWLLAWGIPTRDWRFILVVTLAGILGGLVFQIADTTLSMKEPVWELLLFCEWQALVLAGIAYAHQAFIKINQAA